MNRVNVDGLPFRLAISNKPMVYDHVSILSETGRRGDGGDGGDEGDEGDGIRHAAR